MGKTQENQGFHGQNSKIPKFQKNIHTPENYLPSCDCRGWWPRVYKNILEFWNFGIWVKNPGKSRLSGIPNPFQILKSVKPLEGKRRSEKKRRRKMPSF